MRLAAPYSILVTVGHSSFWLLSFFWAQLFSMASRLAFPQYVQQNVGFVPSWLTPGMAHVALVDPVVFHRCEHSVFSAGLAAPGVIGQRKDLFYPL